MQVFQAPMNRGGQLQLLTEYVGLGSTDGASSDENALPSKQHTATPRTPIPVVFYGQHYDALLDENSKQGIRSEL
jgi:hypothetical protein